MDRQALDDLYRGVGSSPYDPLALLKMVLYQNLKGRRSPATWFEEAKLRDRPQISYWFQVKFRGSIS